jgi:hypothetical protein
MCTTENLNYVQFRQAPVEVAFPTECVPFESRPGYYRSYSSSDCLSFGKMRVNAFDDASCSSYSSGTSFLNTDCVDDDWVGDDYSPGDDYDSAAQLVGVTTNEFCN